MPFCNFLQPPTHLQQYVRKIWYISDLQGTNKLVPCPFPLLILSYNSPLQIKDNNQLKNLPKSALLRPSPAQFIELETEGNTSFIGATLTPLGYKELIANNAFSTIKGYKDLEVFFGVELEKLHQTIANGSPLKDKLDLFYRFLVKNIKRQDSTSATQAYKAIEYILQKKGKVPVSEVANICCTTSRSLQRTFKEYVGASPKQFIALVRFDNALKKMITEPHVSLECISYECGYYDPSHLIKEVKKYTGGSPAHLKENQHQSHFEWFMDMII